MYEKSLIVPHQIKFRSLIGRIRVIDLIPLSDDPDDIAAHFEEIFKRVSQEYHLRKCEAPNLQDSPLRWLKPIAYTLLSFIVEFDLTDVLHARLKKYGRYNRGRGKSSNLFQTGLLAIFADDEGRTKTRRNKGDDFRQELLPPPERKRLGHEMWHAFRHYVPPAFFVGFASQCGSRLVGEGKSGIESVLPEFQDWVVEMESRSGLNSTVRGEYPADIRARVDRLEEARSARDKDW